MSISTRPIGFDDVPADVKRARLNELLALQEKIGLERNRAWLGRDVDVLVDRIVPPRLHEHADGDSDDGGGEGVVAPAEVAALDEVHLSGRSRQNKLVHLVGESSLLGRTIRARVDHAGPYALRGTNVGPMGSRSSPSDHGERAAVRD